MPIVNIHEVDTDCLLGLWRITEISDPESYSFLDRDEYIKSINVSARKSASIAARMLIRQMLSRWKLPYHGVTKDENGKPLLEGYHYHISLSHSGPYAVALLHKTQKVGIDIEHIKEKLKIVAKRVFSDEEIHDTGNNLEKLAVYWSAKEALYKIYGKKKLIFKENISIQPFDLQKDGLLSGEIKTSDFHKKYIVHYQKNSDYVIAYSYQTV